MSVTILVTLMLGIGMNAAVFSLLNAILLRPLPIVDPDTLVVVASDEARPTTSFPQPVWAEFEQRQLLDRSFAWFWTRFNTADRGERQHLDGMVTSAGMFQSLGLRPALGRLLTASDDDLEQGRDGLVAVISDRIWRGRFGADPRVVGQRLRLDDRWFTIVGVMPRDFNGLYVGLPTDVVIPLGPVSSDPSSPYLTIMGRPRGGSSAANATARIRAAQPLIRQATNPHSVAPYRDEYLRTPLLARAAPGGLSFLERRYAQPLTALLAALGTVLLLACGNLAIMLVARSASRQQELAVRAALGASRSRLAQQLGLEAALLALGGTTLAAVVGRGGAAWIARHLGTTSFDVSLDLTMDSRVFAFTALAAVVTVALCGVAPAVIATRGDVMLPLRAAMATGRPRTHLASVVVVLQVTLAVVLVGAAGLFLRTLRSLESVELGFEPRGALTVALDLRNTAATASGVSLLEQISDAVVTVPGVSSVGFSLAMPGGNSALTPWVQLANGTDLPQGPDGVYANTIGAGWLESMGTRMLAGRPFSVADHAGATRVAIVNQAFAERFLPRDAIGHVLRYRTDPDAAYQPLVIVGVVQNAMYRFLREAPPPTVYVPIPLSGGLLPREVMMTVRSAVPLGPDFRRAITSAVLRADGHAFLQFRPLVEQIEAQYTQERLLARGATVFGGLALLLAGVGLYGVTAQVVAGRQREIGIRVALGASSANIVRLVSRRVVLLVGAGVTCGLVVFCWMSPLLASLLFQVTPADRMNLVAACLALLGVAVAATAAPLRRALGVDPAVVLRNS